MAKKKKKRAKTRKAKAPKKLVLTTTRTKKKLVVTNPKKKKRRKPKKRSTTVTVRPNPKKARRRVPKKRGPDELERLSRHLARSPRGRSGDRARPNDGYWRTPRATRAANLRKLARGTPRQKRAAVAIAKCEVAASKPPRASNPAMSDGAALAEYERTHWGKRGRERVTQARAADPRHGTATKLGKLVSVVYLTEKGGDAGPTEYEHTFEKKLPDLVYNNGGLLIAGGSYRIKEGGITG